MKLIWSIAVTMFFLSIWAHADEPTEQLQSITNSACKVLAKENQIVGPWTSNDQKKYWAVLNAKEENKQACLTLIEQSNDKIKLIAKADIPSGFSERYQTYMVPSLSTSTILLADKPLIVTLTPAMSVAGGGGETVDFWMLRSNKLINVYKGKELEYFTSMMHDAAAKTKCKGSIKQLLSDLNRINVIYCANGKLQTVDKLLYVDNNLTKLP